MTDWWWAYLALGGFVGFFSGLLGIGGGSAMVPVLVFIFTAKHVPSDFAVHLALGTGIASILFTSASSVRSHHLHKAVNWQVVRRLIPGVVTGTFGGALLASRLDVRILSITFTALIYYLATRLLLDKKPVATSDFPGSVAITLAGGGIGFVSSLSATGGASLVVPFLVKRNIRVHEAIGTAAAIGWPLAAAGTMGYIISGFATPGLPEYSIGFVYLPALFWIVIASVLVAPLGARIAHRTPGNTLRKIFAILLYVLATKMLLSFF